MSRYVQIIFANFKHCVRNCFFSYLGCSYHYIIKLYKAIPIASSLLFAHLSLNSQSMALPTSCIVLFLSLSVLALMAASSGQVNGCTPPVDDCKPSWCIARSDATDEALNSALNWACGSEGRADCGPIQPHCVCFQPNTLYHHASYAFNSYYQKTAKAYDSCDFLGSAIITYQDPSYGDCHYPSS